LTLVAIFDPRAPMNFSVWVTRLAPSCAAARLTKLQRTFIPPTCALIRKPACDRSRRLIIIPTGSVSRPVLTVALPASALRGAQKTRCREEAMTRRSRRD